MKRNKIRISTKKWLRLLLGMGIIIAAYLPSILLLVPHFQGGLTSSVNIHLVSWRVLFAAYNLLFIAALAFYLIWFFRRAGAKASVKNRPRFSFHTVRYTLGLAAVIAALIIIPFVINLFGLVDWFNYAPATPSLCIVGLTAIVSCWAAMFVVKQMS